ncbi:unnamed protein product [Ascophyllum nodosum]
MAEISEDRLDLLEEKLRARIDTLTGFSDVEVKIRSLEKVFKYFDAGLNGRLDYNQFFAAMTRLNFIGRELESLFDRYDEDCSDSIDYKDFSNHMFGMGEHIAMNSTSRSMVERLKAEIFEQGGATGLRGLRACLERINEDGSGLLEKSELMQGLENFGVEADDGPGGDVEKIMGFFDREAMGRICIKEFHRGLRGNMPKRRKLMVKEAFKRLSDHCGGYVTIGDVRACYNPVTHPDVASGRMSFNDAFDDFLSSLRHADTGDRLFRRHNANRDPRQVLFCDFIDYFWDISAAIDDDEYFWELVLKSWILPVKDDRGHSEDGGDDSDGEGGGGGENSCRALVTHPDGVQEARDTCIYVLVIENARGIGPDSHELMRKRLEEQGVQEIATVSLYV